MNIIQAIKALFAAKRLVESEIKEAKIMNSVGKPAWKTTEFYFNVATQIGIVWSTVQGFLPPKYAAIISTAGVAIYTVARTIAKAVTDVQNIKANQ
jgi:hypothetical protein